MYETVFARSTTENPAGLRPPAWLATGPGGPVRRQPCVLGAVAAAAAHDWSDCAAAPRGRTSAALRPSRPGPGAPIGPRTARCHAGGALCPAPAAAGPADQCGHDVPGPPTPGAPAKKKSLHAAERDTPRVQQARTAYRQRTAALDLRRLKFVDEAGVNLAMTRLYGRAPPGERVIGSVPPNYGENITLLGAIGLQGVQAVMTVNGATDADVFRTYVKRVLERFPIACTTNTHSGRTILWHPEVSAS